MELNSKQQAERAYESIKVCLDDNGWTYQADPEKLRVEFSATGEDLSIEFRVRVNEGRHDVVLYSPMPFKVAEDGLYDVMVAVNMINDSILDGSFDLDVADGSVWYRNSLNFWDMDVPKQTYWYLLMRSAKAIDTFNDKLMMVAKGMYTLAQMEAFVRSV